MGAWLRRHWEAWTLAGGVAASAAVSLVWVFLVPIYQGPDEPVHLDYALCLYENGGLFRANDVAVARRIMEAPRYRGYPYIFYLLHPYSLYLVDRTELATVHFNAAAKMPPGYGTADYFAALDRDRPPRPARIEAPPAQAYYYPFGYYGLLALWIGGVRQFSDSLVVTFFAARAFSTVLLVVTLLFTHATLKALGYRSRFRLVLTAIIGLFPLTSFVSSYVQPDNLGLTLASAAFYFAVRVRLELGRPLPLAALGLALGGLLATKLHFYLAVSVPVAAMLAAELVGRRAGPLAWLRTVTLVGWPSLAAGTVYAWTIWGLDYHPLHSVAARHGHGFLSFAVFMAEGLQKAFENYYAGGTHNTFWGVFGWADTPLVIGGPNTDFLVRFTVQAFTWVLLALTLVRAERVGSRLWRLARRGRPALALRLACSDPITNSYFLFTALMVALFVRTDNIFAAQGRNWLPFLLPIFLTGLVYAPKALTLRPSRRLLSRAATAGLALYTLAACGFAPATLRARFYAPGNEQPMAAVPVATRPETTHAMAWANNAGDSAAADGRAVFRLPPADHVYCVRMRFVLTDPAGRFNSLQAHWTGPGETFAAANGFVFRVKNGPCEQDLTVWINGPADRIRITPATRPCHFELREMVAMVRPGARHDGPATLASGVPPR